MMQVPWLTLGTHLAVALLAGGLGWKVRDGDYQGHLAKDAQSVVIDLEKARAATSEREAISQQVREALAQDNAKVRIVTNTVTERVPYYVTSTPAEKALSDSGGLPLGFVWDYNGAIRASAAPLPPGTNPGDPTGISLSDLATNAAQRAELCNRFRDETGRWHDWYNRLNTQEQPKGVSPNGR